MSLLTAGRALLASAGSAQRELAVEVLAPTRVENPHFPDQFTLDWDNPIVVDTVNGVRQPVTEEAAVRLGLTSLVDVRALYLDPVDLTPEARVRVDGEVYRVRDVKAYASHVEAVVERVAEGASP